jgi:hypothetical protein
MPNLRVNTIKSQDGTKGPTFDGDLEFFGESHIVLPKGTTAQRPTGVAAGSMRFNTDTKLVEQYNGVEWVTLNSQFVNTYLPVKDGLVLYLDAGNTLSYPGSGTTWTDLSGNINNGTLTNGPTYSSANGGSIVFDGVNDEVTTTTQYTNPQIFSIGVWFKTSTASGKKIIGFETNQTGTGSLSYDRQIYIGTDGKLYFGIYDGVTNEAISPLTYTDNNWHYVVGTYGGEGTTLRLYVDGVSVATATASFAENYNGYWRICGYKTNSWTNTSDGYFSGSISNVVVYNRALAVSEIQQNFNTQRGRFNI